MTNYLYVDDFKKPFKSILIAGFVFLFPKAAVLVIYIKLLSFYLVALRKLLG